MDIQKLDGISQFLLPSKFYDLSFQLFIKNMRIINPL